eukprot:11434636-Alexandrium_andersonii.AAC.1
MGARVAQLPRIDGVDAAAYGYTVGSHPSGHVPSGGLHDGSPLSGPCAQVVSAVGMCSSDIFRHVEK